jgi:hypothetical protein
MMADRCEKNVRVQNAQIQVKFIATVYNYIKNSENISFCVAIVFNAWYNICVSLTMYSIGGKCCALHCLEICFFVEIALLCADEYYRQ